VQDLADEVDFKPLAESIKSLVHSSHALDSETVKAVDKLHKLLPKHPKLSLAERLTKTFSLGSGCHQPRISQMELWEDDDGEKRELFPHLPHAPHVPHLPDLKNLKEIKKVLEEIRTINKKRQGFESGFISEEGIKVRRNSPIGRETTGRGCLLMIRTGSGTSTRESLPELGSDTAPRP